MTPQRQTDAMASLESISGRVDRLEADYFKLSGDLKSILKTQREIDKNIDRMAIALEGVKRREDGRREMIQRINMFVIGSVVAAVMAFVLSGGLYK